jgi:hypothetical protein
LCGNLVYIIQPLFVFGENKFVFRELQECILQFVLAFRDFPKYRRDTTMYTRLLLKYTRENVLYTRETLKYSRDTAMYIREIVKYIYPMRFPYREIVRYIMELARYKR